MLKNIIEKLIIIITIVTLSIVLLSNIFFTSEIENDVTEVVNINKTTVISFGIACIIILVIVLVCMYIKKDKISKKLKIVLLSAIIIAYAIINVLWINTTKGEPVADQKEINQIATKLANGEIEQLKENHYLELNPQQIGTSFVVATIYRVCHSTNYHIIQYFNVVCNIVSIVMMYIIMKQFMKEYKFDKYMYYIISFTFIPLILLSSFVYGDYIGLMFSILGVYTIMKYTSTRKIQYIAISAILLAISYIAKSNYLIVLLAVIIYLVLDFLLEHNWKKILMIVLFILISILPNTVLKNVMANKLNLDKTKSIPSIAYINMGMNESDRQAGWYNSSMDYAWGNDTDKAEYYSAQLKERTIELIKHPIYTLKFYSKKIISMWTEVTFGGIWYNLPFQANNHEEYLQTVQENGIFYSICIGKTSIVIGIYQKALVILIFLGALWAVWKNRKNQSINFILLITIILGGFFFHVLWEAKSRYILPYVIYMIPVATIGCEDLITKIQNYIYKKRVKGEN